PQLFWLQNHYVALWINRASRAIHLQTFESDLTPLGTVQTLTQLAPTHTFRWLRGFPAKDERFALAWQTEMPGMDFSDSGEPLPELELYLAPLDISGQRLISPVALGRQAESFFTAGWLGEYLITVHGGTGVVTPFVLRS
ncbi:MAG: hypothetical protein MI924_09170, partial [Chloroflexales bacterium]|nr:hypothetical protein [Chloroflexales bacterium]